MTSKNNGNSLFLLQAGSESCSFTTTSSLVLFAFFFFFKLSVIDHLILHQFAVSIFPNAPVCGREISSVDAVMKIIELTCDPPPLQRTIWVDQCCGQSWGPPGWMALILAAWIGQPYGVDDVVVYPSISTAAMLFHLLGSLRGAVWVRMIKNIN